MRYFSTTECKGVDIDVATADMPALLDAYNSFMDMSDSGGAFPGSAAWKKAQVYSDRIAALEAARPEIKDYRAQVAAAKRDARLAGKDLLGM